MSLRILVVLLLMLLLLMLLQPRRCGGRIARFRHHHWHRRRCMMRIRKMMAVIVVGEVGNVALGGIVVAVRLRRVVISTGLVVVEFSSCSFPPPYFQRGRIWGRKWRPCSSASCFHCASSGGRRRRRETMAMAMNMIVMVMRRILFASVHDDSISLCTHSNKS